MNKLSLLPALAVLLLFHAGAQAADDTIKKSTGEQIRGAITGMTKNDVTYEQGGNSKKIDVVDIDSIRFAEEPPALNSVRNQAANGAFENALRTLDRLNAENVERTEIKQDIQFLRAYCNGKLALGGSVDVTTAGRELNAFVKDCPNNYHWLAANELIGDLLVASQKYADATKFYKALADSPFPEYQMRAGVATGRALLAEKKYAEAQKQFEAVADLAAKGGEAAKPQLAAATIGKAACLGETGNPDEAIKLIDGVVGTLPKEEVDLHAQAYLTLGKCYRKKADGVKPALLAFLHVDVLYFSNAQAHAEALWNLAELWPSVHKLERAQEATALLKERYPNSVWAKMSK